jgi:hypothetical protein
MRLLQVCSSSSLGIKMICGLYGDKKGIVKEKNYIPRNFRRINFFFNGFELIKILFIFYLGRFWIELDLLQTGKLQILFIFVQRN